MWNFLHLCKVNTCLCPQFHLMRRGYGVGIKRYQSSRELLQIMVVKKNGDLGIELYCYYVYI